MKPKWTYLLAIVAILAAAGVFGQVTAQVSVPASQPAKASSTAVAVCDVSEILNNYKRVEDLKAEMNKKMAEMKKEEDAKREGIQTAGTELQALKKGSKDYQDKQANVDRQVMEFQAWGDMQKFILQRQYQELTEEMYNSVLDSVRAVATARGCQLVVYKDDIELGNSKNPDELRAKMSQRKVLYNDPSLDITTAVLTHLNDQYDKTKK
jgi:Skp family chaperone for outer membrane proteins